MGKWKNVRIGEFLTERQGRYKPDDNAIVTYKRLDKIDFSGTIHISEKPSKTDMIVVQPGDLVISGINVAKGAIAVYQGVEPVTATIHYSSYIFDDSVVDLEYFKYFVKSPTFIETLKKQAKGGIKTEIKPKVFLPLEISLPDLPTQKQIVKRISVNLKRVNELAKEIETQKGYAKQLRRNILQDAIEGKLTADWRKEHPVQKGNPDYDAEALFESIQKERKVDKKRKALPPILDAEKPFELPTGWKWMRLGEIIKEVPRNGYSPKAVDFETNTKTLKLGAVTSGVFDSSQYKYINEEIPKESYCWLKNGDILIERSNSLEYVGICAIYTGKDNDFIYPDLLMKIQLIEPISSIYIHTVLMAPFNRQYFMSNAKGSQKTMPKINQECVSNTLIPLPPLAEQQQIITSVSTMFNKVSEIERQIQEREILSEKLSFGIIKENLEGTEVDNMAEPIDIDVQSGSRSYNRLDMQVTQALHMAIELFDNVNFLLVMDYYDDITIFDDSDNPQSVSYYQMKTSNDTITVATILREEWLPKLYAHLNNPTYLIKNLGLITNCPIKFDSQILREEETPFSKINEQTVAKIKEDISKKMGITVSEINLSKFIHVRTTLTIERHRDIAEQELGNFLLKKYPKITLEATKTIFQSIIDMLTKRQEYELLPKDSDFTSIRAKKGISREDMNRAIKMTMLIALPEFQTIEKMIDFQEEERNKASYEYTRILVDLQKRDEGIYSLLLKLQNKMNENPMSENEEYEDYAKRIIDIVPRNPIYNDWYRKILIFSILYNSWKDN